MITLEDYARMLQSHDWFYEMSDDNSVWKRGLDERGEINMAKRQLVEAGFEAAEKAYWKAYAPEYFGGDPKGA